jgi:RNA polymerase sigma factor (sigma-70 family)
MTAPAVAFIADSGESYTRMNDRAGGASTDDIDEIRNALDSKSKPLFEAAFREHHASLVQYLRRRVGSDADARDIAQEAYLRLLRYHENQDLDSLKALLFRIATNLVGMRARTARTQHWADHRPLDEELVLPTNDPSQEQRVAGEQQLDRMMEVIKRLPSKCQQVFVLSRFHDMSYPEIATRCGISVKMVEKHIAKALAICRTEVGDDQP